MDSQHDAIADGQSAADYDYHHVGSDFACEIAGDLPADATPMEVSRAMASFAEENATEWVAEARAHFAADSEDADAAMQYAIAYVARYFLRIRDRVHAVLKDRDANGEFRCASCDLWSLTDHPNACGKGYCDHCHSIGTCDVYESGECVSCTYAYDHDGACERCGNEPAFVRANDPTSPNDVLCERCANRNTCEACGIRPATVHTGGNVFACAECDAAPRR